MTYIILFEDNPAVAPDIRAVHMADHLAFLEANAAQVTAAGPLATPAGAGAGGLWIVDAATEAEAKALVHADPFWPTGLRQSFTILRWTRVFADGHRIAKPGA